MLKVVGDAGNLHVARFGNNNGYNHNTKRHEFGFGLIDISGITGQGKGLRFDNKQALDNFLLKNSRLKFDPNGMFLILDVYHDNSETFVIVEYDGYAYTIRTSELVFMALYDKKACDFHKRLI